MRALPMLDLFFKKYAWTANLALIFAAAWLTARTVNTVVGTALRPRPRIDLAALPAAPARAQPRPELETDRLYALFGLKPPPKPEAGPVDEPTPPPRTCDDPDATPVHTGLRAQLVAGILADNPRASLASITDLNTRETKVYGVGDPLMGATLISIERLRDPRDATGAGFTVAAVVCNNGQKEFVDFEGGTGGGGGGPPPPGRLGPAPGGGEEPEAAGGPGDSVHKLADNRYDVKKKFVEDQLSNLSQVATQARIVPSFKNGVANGFKVFSIQPNSLYSAIGVENGDVIQRINGYEINSPDKALEVYQKLRESPHISIEIERNGQTIRKEYNITGP